VDDPNSPKNPNAPGDPNLPVVPEEETTLPVGTRLGKYQIVRLLGAGGMGAVYEAQHTEIGKRVAVKTLAPAVAAIPGARQRFLREAQLTSRLRHPHVVDLTDMGTEGRIAYLVMELLAGEDLSQRFDRTGRMAPRELVDLMLPVCSALSAAHEAGIVHRDLKPQNIFLAKGPRGVEPKVLDFGISKSTDSDVSGLTGTGSVIGTPHYLAPEQIKDARTASAASDQYSLGVIFYKCLTGQNPFEGDSIFSVLQAIVTETAVPLGELRGDLPEGLDRVVARAMNRLQGERFPSVRELGRALLPYASAKARVIWEETFAPAAASDPEAAPERDSHTMPMPTPQPSPARFASPIPTAKAAVGDSGTLSPAVTSASSLGLRTRPRGGRGKMIVGVLGGVALAAGAFAVFTRGATSPPPAAPAAAPIAAPAGTPAAPPVAAPAAPPVGAPAPPAAPVAAAPPAAAAVRAEEARAKEARENEAREKAAAAKREEDARAAQATPARPGKTAGPERRHRGGSHGRSDTPAGPASSAPRNLNPNGAPVID
jgi:serine/threonine-protein kinase